MERFVDVDSEITYRPIDFIMSDARLYFDEKLIQDRILSLGLLVRLEENGILYNFFHGDPNVVVCGAFDSFREYRLSRAMGTPPLPADEKITTRENVYLLFHNPKLNSLAFSYGYDIVVVDFPETTHYRPSGSAGEIVTYVPVIYGTNPFISEENFSATFTARLTEWFKRKDLHARVAPMNTDHAKRS